jgi:hypothetical protein
LLFWAGWKAPWCVMPLSSAVSEHYPFYTDPTLALSKVERAGNLLFPLESRSTHSLLVFDYETLFFCLGLLLECPLLLILSCNPTP